MCSTGSGLQCCHYFIHSLPATTICTLRVLKAETCFVTLCHFSSSGGIQKVIMDECLEGMVVIVACVKLPGVTATMWAKVCSTPVHCQAVKAEKKASGVGSCGAGRIGEASFFQCTREISDGLRDDVCVPCYGACSGTNIRNQIWEV